MRPAHLLPTVVFAQFAGTSLWFAVNAVLPDLQQQFPDIQNFLPTMTAAVQLGFVVGTLMYAWQSIADRFSPVRVFVVSTIVAAGTNLLLLIFHTSLYELVALRFTVGFFLAGVYPVGMKICSDWYERGLGKALGYLVGALVLGTAFPHLLKALSLHMDWRWVILATSGLALSGAMFMGLLVRDGPFRRPLGKFNPGVLGLAFRQKLYRTYAFGYFGHMWELYTFWAFTPVIIGLYNRATGDALDVSGWSFGIIAMGALGCALGGELSLHWGSRRLAFGALLASTLCCLISPLMVWFPPIVFLVFMMVWGTSVVADSPQFSALVAQNALPEYRATAITIVNSIGFFITIPSLYCMQWAFTQISERNSFILLALGGIFGLGSIWGARKH
ncbi:MAG: MFS transporter [Phycisphaerae bacterium]|nr:MFS transporter [Saprospiraceae bacterium]